MPSLSDRLKALGVQLGADQSAQEKPARKVPIESIVEGEAVATPEGEIFLVQALYPLEHPHGRGALRLSAPLNLIAAWAGEERIAANTPEQFAFIDTETTGLSGGTGTIAFMVGAGRFEPDGFRLAQFFMREPGEEPALLYALEEFLAPAETVVSFNGKSFDIPLLHTRYTANSRAFPLGKSAHLDLLHLARRLWRDRLPDLSLIHI